MDITLKKFIDFSKNYCSTTELLKQILESILYVSTKK